MRFSAAVAVSALAAGVSATYNYTTPSYPSYTTEVVTEYTTYCPGATEITYGGQTYTATSETTLTITNCPCTITYPVTSSVVTSCPTTSVPHTTYAPPPTTYAPTTSAPYTTAPYTPTTYAPSSTSVYTSTGSPIPTNAAGKAVVGSGAGLAAIFGLALAL